jgi:hypothetical protein
MMPALSGFIILAPHRRGVCSVIGTAVFHEPQVTRGNGGVVLVRNIDFSSTCQDTLMPFHGQCHIAYVPSEPLVLGLSKLARLVNAHSKRICSQQGLADALKSAVEVHMPCQGVYVCTSACHLAHAAQGGHSVCSSTSGCFDTTSSVQSRVRLFCSACGGCASCPCKCMVYSNDPIKCRVIFQIQAGAQCIGIGATESARPGHCCL